MNEWSWFVLELNPEPWAIGPVGYARRGGKMSAYVGRNAQLDAYKEAIRDEIGDGYMLIEGKVELRFWFWRNMAEYKTPQARTHRKHEADGTNMAKATEDALQGVLFKNDKDTNHMVWTVVEQGPDVVGKLVIAIRKSEYPYDYKLPDDVVAQLSEIDSRASNEVDLDYPADEEMF